MTDPPSRQPAYQRRQAERSHARILSDMADQGDPQSFIDFVDRWIRGEGENPRAPTMRARARPKEREPRFPAVWREKVGQGGKVQSDDPRRNRAADAAFFDHPKGGDR
jgi:hypothetical protein